MIFLIQSPPLALLFCSFPPASHHFSNGPSLIDINQKAINYTSYFQSNDNCSIVKKIFLTLKVNNMFAVWQTRLIRLMQLVCT